MSTKNYHPWTTCSAYNTQITIEAWIQLLQFTHTRIYIYSNDFHYLHPINNLPLPPFLPPMPFSERYLACTSLCRLFFSLRRIFTASPPYKIVFSGPTKVNFHPSASNFCVWNSGNILSKLMVGQFSPMNPLRKVTVRYYFSHRRTTYFYSPLTPLFSA